MTTTFATQTWRVAPAAAFAREYVTPNGRDASDAQTAYSLAIVYDLVGGDAQSLRG